MMRIAIMRPMHDAPDFELLRVFDHLYRFRHLTRASRQLGLSQPAVSRALSRLRLTFDDPLFVKTGAGMAPTPRAEQVAADVREVLRRAAALIQPTEFTPSTLERTFAIGTVDYLEVDVLPRILRALADEAPNVSVASRPLGLDASEALLHGRLDLAVGLRRQLPAEAMAQQLFEDDFVCAVREGHPTVKRSLSLQRFVELGHILIAPRGEPGSVVDSALEQLGLVRRIAVRTHTFLGAPTIAAQTDYVLTGPRRVVLPMAAKYGLRTFAPPLELAPFAVHQAWHPRVQDDPAHSWFRALVHRCAAEPTRRASKR
jgi:DNA-binding transcriptional LysR family regulator